MNTYHQEAAVWHKGQAKMYRTRLSKLLGGGKECVDTVSRLKGISEKDLRRMAEAEQQLLTDEVIQDTRWWIEAEERNVAEAEAGTMVPVVDLFRGRCAQFAEA